jgi:hypothetical protein
MTHADATQDSFAAGLLDAGRPVPAGLTDGAGRPAGRRYSVYRNNVAVSLRAALETGFPAVARLIGPENFARAAGIYLRAEPPGSPMMMRYGAGFPAFLERVEALSGIGYLGDVARLEYALRCSYHAADAPPLDPRRLSCLTGAALETARLTLAPSVRILRSRWPVLSVYRYTMTPGSPKPQARAEDVVITRADLDPVPHLLPPGGADFLEALRTGAPLGAAQAGAAPDTDLSTTLGLLLQNGAFTDISTT